MFSQTRSSARSASLLCLSDVVNVLAWNSLGPAFWINAPSPEVPQCTCGQRERAAASPRSRTCAGGVCFASAASVDAALTLRQKKEAERFNSNVKSILQHGSIKAQVLMVMTRIIKMHHNREAKEQV